MINKLTGEPISEEMQSVLKRLAANETVPESEIYALKEIREANSCISNSVPTIELNNRSGIQLGVFNRLQNMGSAVIEDNGAVSFTGEIHCGRRLDIVIGLPASGKSSALVEPISEMYKSRVIDSDEAKKLLFIIIPSSDATFNFLAAMMYTQLFDTLYDTANFKYGGRLPVHVRCLLDEFANVGTIPDFDKLLATMRSMEISANIIIQNLAQLKKMYDKSWEILTGNCDSLLFFGGQEASTLEAISKSLGKETIDVVSQNRTRSHKSPSTSENNSILGRELMTTDELKVMKPNECVLIVRALYPFFCHKFDIEKHQNYKYLEDSNKNYAYLIDDLHTEKAPDMTEIYSETVEPKPVLQPADDEKDISDIDVPDEEDNMTNLDEEFDTKEIAASLKQHEEQTAGEEMFNENEELDFSDEPVPENLMPMDLSTPKVIGEADFREIVDSPF